MSVAPLLWPTLPDAGVLVVQRTKWRDRSNNQIVKWEGMRGTMSAGTNLPRRLAPFVRRKPHTRPSARESAMLMPTFIRQGARLESRL